jgi:tetratricopeptide (TPR) repeat protein
VGPRLHCLGATVLVFFALAEGTARADAPPADPAREATSRYELGIKLYEAGKFEAAIAEFEAAYALRPHHELLYNLGVAQKRLLRLGAARGSFKRFLSEGGERIPADRRALIEQEIASIVRLAAEVEVRVVGAPASIDVDGQPAGTSPLADPLLVLSGSHSFRATREGHDPAEQRLEVVSGRKYTLDLTPRQKPVLKTTGDLSVVTRPPGATLIVDDRPVGSAPWDGTLPAGGHRIIADLAGYQQVQQEVLLVAGQSRLVAIELPAESTPWYKRWYVWTAAAIVAGGASGGYYYYTTLPRVDLALQNL